MNKTERMKLVRILGMLGSNMTASAPAPQWPRIA